MDRLTISRGHRLEGTLFTGLDHLGRHLLGESSERGDSPFPILRHVNQYPVRSARTLRLNHRTGHLLERLKGGATRSDENTKFRRWTRVD